MRYFVVYKLLMLPCLCCIVLMSASCRSPVRDTNKSLFMTDLSELSQVLVLGKGVMQPGIYPLRDGVGLLKVINKAGGFSEFAHLARIRIYRGDKILEINAWKSYQGRESDFELIPGDVVYVNKSSFP